MEQYIRTIGRQITRTLLTSYSQQPENVTERTARFRRFDDLKPHADVDGKDLHQSRNKKTKQGKEKRILQ